MKHIIAIIIIIISVVSCSKSNVIENPPVLIINTPDKTVFNYGEKVSLIVDVYDHWEANGNKIFWYVEENGEIKLIGRGHKLNTDNLGSGNHEVKVIYKSESGVGKDRITISVEPPEQQKEIASNQRYA
jgi:hypothetical protein